MVFVADSARPTGWRLVGGPIVGEALSDGASRVSLSADGTIVTIGAANNDGTGTSAGHVRAYILGATPSARPTVAPSAPPTPPPSERMWAQFGGDIDGETAGDNSGAAIAVSSNGLTVVIGAVGNEGDSRDGMNETGHVRVYTYNPTRQLWQQVGSDINGLRPNDLAGSSVAVSDDGLTIAVGLPGGRDPIQVYQAVTSSDILGNTDPTGTDWRFDSGFGFVAPAAFNGGDSIAISGDGSVIAIGSPNVASAMDAPGSVVISRLTSEGRWEPTVFTAATANDEFGASVDLSYNGSVVIVGSPGSANGKGLVSILEWNPSASTYSVPRETTGQSLGERYGTIVAVSSDGTTVAASTLNTVAAGSEVRIFGLDFTQIGDGITTAAGSTSPDSFSLSGDGRTVVVGADKTESTPGTVRVFELAATSTRWRQAATDLVGEFDGDGAGTSVAVSFDGSVVAIGAPGNDAVDGSDVDRRVNAGHVRAYSLRFITDAPTSTPTRTPLEMRAVTLLFIADYDELFPANNRSNQIAAFQTAIGAMLFAALRDATTPDYVDVTRGSVLTAVAFNNDSLQRQMVSAANACDLQLIFNGRVLVPSLQTAPTCVQTTWLTDYACPSGHLATAFDNTNTGVVEYSTHSEAMDACAVACFAEDDCEYANLFWAGAQAVTCNISNSGCGDFATNPQDNTSLWVRNGAGAPTMAPTASPQGVGFQASSADEDTESSVSIMILIIIAVVGTGLLCYLFVIYARMAKRNKKERKVGVHDSMDGEGDTLDMMSLEAGLMASDDTDSALTRAVKSLGSDPTAKEKIEDVLMNELDGDVVDESADVAMDSYLEAFEQKNFMAGALGGMNEIGDDADGDGVGADRRHSETQRLRMYESRARKELFSTHRAAVVDGLQKANCSQEMIDKITDDFVLEDGSTGAGQSDRGGDVANISSDITSAGARLESYLDEQIVAAEADVAREEAALLALKQGKLPQGLDLKDGLSEAEIRKRALAARLRLKLARDRALEAQRMKHELMLRHQLASKLQLNTMEMVAAQHQLDAMDEEAKAGDAAAKEHDDDAAAATTELANVEAALAKQKAGELDVNAQDWEKKAKEARLRLKLARARAKKARGEAAARRNQNALTQHMVANRDELEAKIAAAKAEIEAQHEIIFVDLPAERAAAADGDAVQAAEDLADLLAQKEAIANGESLGNNADLLAPKSTGELEREVQTARLRLQLANSRAKKQRVGQLQAQLRVRAAKQAVESTREKTMAVGKLQELDRIKTAIALNTNGNGLSVNDVQKQSVAAQLRLKLSENRAKQHMMLRQQLRAQQALADKMVAASERAAGAHAEEIDLEATVERKQDELSAAKAAGTDVTMLEVAVMHDIEKLQVVSERAHFFSDFNRKAEAEDTMWKTPPAIIVEQSGDDALAEMLIIAREATMMRPGAEHVDPQQAQDLADAAVQILATKFKEELDLLVDGDMAKKNTAAREGLVEAEEEEKDAASELLELSEKIAAKKQAGELNVNAEDWEQRAKVAQLRLKLAHGRAKNARDLHRQRRTRDLQLSKLLATEQMARSVDGTVSQLEEELEHKDELETRIRGGSVGPHEQAKLDMVEQEKADLQSKLDVAVERARYAEDVRAEVLAEMDPDEAESLRRDTAMSNCSSGGGLLASGGWRSGSTVQMTGTEDAAMQLLDDAEAMETEAQFLEDGPGSCDARPATPLLVPEDSFTDRPNTPSARTAMTEKEMRDKATRAHLKKKLAHKRALKAQQKSTGLRQQSKMIANHARAAAKAYLRTELMQEIDQVANAEASKANAVVAQARQSMSRQSFGSSKAVLAKSLRKSSSLGTSSSKSAPSPSRRGSLSAAGLMRRVADFKLVASETQVDRIRGELAKHEGQLAEKLKRASDVETAQKPIPTKAAAARTMRLIKFKLEIALEINTGLKQTADFKRRDDAVAAKAAREEAERKAAVLKAAEQEAAAAEREHAAKFEKRKAELAQIQVEATRLESGSWRSAANRVLKAQQEQLDLLKATKDDRENMMMVFASKYGDVLEGERGSLPPPPPADDPWDSLGHPRDFVRTRLPPLPSSTTLTLRGPNNLPSYPWGSAGPPALDPFAGLAGVKTSPTTFSGLSPSNLSIIDNIKKVKYRTAPPPKPTKKAPPRAVVKVAKAVDGSRIDTGLRKKRKAPPKDMQGLASGLTPLSPNSALHSAGLQSAPSNDAFASVGANSFILDMPLLEPGQLPELSSSTTGKQSSSVV